MNTANHTHTIDVPSLDTGDEHATYKRADEVTLHDRLHIPGTSIAIGISFIHHRAGMVLFETDLGQTFQRAAGDELRVIPGG